MTFQLHVCTDKVRLFIFILNYACVKNHPKPGVLCDMKVEPGSNALALSCRCLNDCLSSILLLHCGGCHQNLQSY